MDLVCAKQDLLEMMLHVQSSLLSSDDQDIRQVYEIVLCNEITAADVSLDNEQLKGHLLYLI